MATTRLFGRDDETQVLRNAFQNCLADEKTAVKKRQQMVLIHGPSGSGKTAVATRTLRPLLAQHNGLLLTGKADATAQWSRPFSIFVSAFQQLIHVLEHDQDRNGLLDVGLAEQVRNAILNEFGDSAINGENEKNFDDGRLLSSLIPGFESVLKRTINGSAETSVLFKHPAGTGKAVARLRHLLSRLCRTVASQVPFVLFLDDIQWCDHESFHLLNSVLSSNIATNGTKELIHSNTSLLVICAYRETSSDEDFTVSSRMPAQKHPAPLVEFLQKWKEPTLWSCDLDVYDIALKNVNEVTLNAILSGVYGLPQMEFYSQFIHKASAGNIYLALQCVRQLCDEGLLYRCEETDEWKWDFSQLQAQDDATAQFLLDPAFSDIVRHTITQLSDPAQHVLSVASCFGMEIDEEVLSLLYRDEEDIVPSAEEAVEEAMNEGLVISDPIIGRRAFAHDRVQQAAHALIDDVDAMSFEIGYKLLKRCTPSMLKSRIFVVVNLLDKGSPAGNKAGSRGALLPVHECYAVAKLNLEAGEKAVSIAAFSDATYYLEKGVALLMRGGKGATYWMDEYQLTLDLLSATAHVHIFNQNFERVDELVDEVCGNAKSFRDEYRVRMVRMTSTSLRGRFQDAVQMGNGILRHYDERIPSRATLPVILSDLFRTKLALRGKSNEVLLALPIMENRDKIAATNVMNSMFQLALLVKSAHTIVLATRSIRLCLRHGTSAGSAMSFIMYAFVLCQMGDVEEGMRFSQLAMSLVERGENREILSCVSSLFYYGVHHRKHPLRESIAGLQRAFRVGMEVGEVEYAMISDSVAIHHSWFMGCKLQDVNVLLKEGLSRRKVYDHPATRGFLWAVVQTVDRLSDVSPYVDVAEYVRAATARNLNESDKDLQLSAVFHYGTLLAYIFRDFEPAHKTIRRVTAESRRLIVSTAPGLQLDWLDGLTSVAMARKRTKNRAKHMRKAKRMLKVLAKKAQECPSNCLHMHDLLRAEYVSVSVESHCTATQSDYGRMDLYDSAIDKALKEGFRHVAAIAAERAGDYMLSLGFKSRAEKYLGDAHSYYQEWGAMTKARSLASRMSTMALQRESSPVVVEAA